MVFNIKGDRNPRTGKPTFNKEQAIKEGYQDHLDERGGEEKITTPNNTKSEAPQKIEIPRGQGVVSVEPFGDQAGTNDWDGGSDEEVVPEFYKVQDKTGRIKFTSDKIEDLASLYEELTGPDGGDKLIKLSPMLRDILEMAMKIKDGQYKSIDGLAADIAICANIVSEDPKDLKKNFENISNTLGVASDSQKRLFDLSTYNSRSLNNVVLPNEKKEEPNELEKAVVQSQAESDITNKTIDPYDVEILEKQIEKFKEIQTTGRLSKTELDTFIALTELKEKGWKNIVYRDLPSSILSLTRYSDRSPDSNEINVAALERKIEEYKKIQRESALTPEQLEDFIKLTSLKERGWENVSISELTEGTSTDTISSETKTGKNQTPISIAATEAVRRMQERAATLGTELGGPVKKLEGIGERTLKKVKEALTRKGVEVPEGSLLTSQDVVSKGGGELLKSVVSGSPVKGFMGRMKGWWNKKWNAPHESGLVSSSSEVFNATTTIGLVILALLGVNKPKTEAVAVAQATITQQLDQKEVSRITGGQSQEVTEKKAIPETIITPEMIQACQKGDNSYMIKCIKAVVNGQETNIRNELTTHINKAAEARAAKEGISWVKLNAREKDAYVDAVLGGDKNSPSGRIAEELNLTKNMYRFSGMDDLKKRGLNVSMPERPESVPVGVIIRMIRALETIK